MSASLQELLLCLPFHHLTFHTSLPQELIHYQTIIEDVPDGGVTNHAILLLHDEDYEKLSVNEVVDRIIQDSNIVGIVIHQHQPLHIQEESCALFQECGLPVIQVHDDSSVLPFLQEARRTSSPYSQLSREIHGFMEKGFVNSTMNLAKALNTPLLYLDHQFQLLWQTGDEDILHEAHRWLNLNLRRLVKGTEAEPSANGSSQNDEVDERFQAYPIYLAGLPEHTLVASGHLVDWQKRMLDKLVSLISMFLQTNEMFRLQQEEFKEHFIYDLLYHKFESRKVMIKQGKAWGWNLEKPHHLLLINIDPDNELIQELSWLDCMVRHLQEWSEDENQSLIVFTFQDQLVLMLEDERERTSSERKSFALEVANKIEAELKRKWRNCTFQMGIGKWYPESVDLNKSYQEAQQALQFGRKWNEHKRIFHINDLGVLRLLIHIHQGMLTDFTDEYLSQLIESDFHHGTDYITTLQAYIQHRGNINEVSDTLYIHPNTLRKRVKKLEEMTGVDFQDPEEFSNLLIAVRILSFLHP